MAKHWQSAPDEMEGQFEAWARRHGGVAKIPHLWRFTSQDVLTEALRQSFGPRAARQRTGLMAALPPSLVAPRQLARALKERFIAEMFPVVLTHQLKIAAARRDCARWRTPVEGRDQW
jgi:hypothetical protein